MIGENNGGMCEKIKALREKLSWLPPLLTRITIGFVFIESGWGKLHHLEKVISFFTELGIPAAQIQAPFVATVELVCGTAVLLGFFTRMVSIPLICTMIVAIITAKRADLTGIGDLFGFIEYLYIALLVWLIVDGPGCLSLDHALWRRKDKQQ